MKKLTIITSLVLLSTFTALGQTPMESATTKYNAGNWQEAMSDYKTHLESAPNDSAAWYYLARCQMNLGEYENSLKTFKKAKDLNFNANFIDFNLAKIYAVQGQDDKMYTTLETAADNGLFILAQLKTDTVFLEFQENQKFQKILEKVRVNAYPCLSDKDKRHFDFWIGEWDVYFNGQKVGENSITLAEGGCAVHENYVTQGNYAGQSINFYSPVDEKWHQHWVGSAGDVYNYMEIDRGEGMLQFLSDYVTPNGEVQQSRLTFTKNDDGTVTQLFENSADKGTTWTESFKGIYKKNP